jgi:hypothetical protein
MFGQSLTNLHSLINLKYKKATHMFLRVSDSLSRTHKYF